MILRYQRPVKCFYQFRGNAQTSRSNSSGPANGSSKLVKISIPGASTTDGGMDILEDSGLRRARCAEGLNAQFLWVYRICGESRLNFNQLHYFILEATPPLRIVSLCSVNTTSFARGYSRSPFGCTTFEHRGVKKNVRPVGVCDYNNGAHSLLRDQRTYHSQIRKDTRKEM